MINSPEHYEAQVAYYRRQERLSFWGEELTQAQLVARADRADAVTAQQELTAQPAPTRYSEEGKTRKAG